MCVYVFVSLIQCYATNMESPPPPTLAIADSGTNGFGARAAALVWLAVCGFGVLSGVKWAWWHLSFPSQQGPASATTTYFTFGHVSDFEGSALRLIGRWVLSMGATLRGAPVFVFGLLGGGGAWRGI